MMGSNIILTLIGRGPKSVREIMAQSQFSAEVVESRIADLLAAEVIEKLSPDVTGQIRYRVKSR